MRVHVSVCLCVCERVGVCLPGNVPGISQRLPQMILLLRRLLAQKNHSLRLKERSHDRRREILITVKNNLHTNTHVRSTHTHTHTHTDKQIDRQASHQIQYREQTVNEFSCAGIINLPLEAALMSTECLILLLNHNIILITYLIYIYLIYRHKFHHII